MSNRFQQFIDSGDTHLQREFILHFDRRGHWIDDYIKGYTHVRVATKGDNRDWIWFDPSYQGALQYIQYFPRLKGLHVTTTTGDNNLACRFGVQTCATLVQYVMGVWLGAYTPEKLFRILTQNDDSWLFERGVLEVESWGQNT